MANEVNVYVPDAEFIKGEAGFSPRVYEEAIPGGHKIIIIDADGEHEFIVMNGEKGEKGEKGDPGNYTKPEDGIPKTDLASDVRASLGKADTAIRLGITGASVGDLVRVAAVDANGKPTSWSHVPLCDIVTNENLLDNWYFAGGGSAGQFPINQRGKSIYGNVNEGIDRWKIQASGRGTVAVNSDCIRLTKTSASGGGSFQVVQTLEREVSGPLTLSALIRSSGSAYSISIRDANGTNLKAIDDTVSSSLHLVQATCSGSGNPAKTIRLACSSAAEADSYVEVIAIKLEIGSEQTLAHLENGNPVLNELPNYQQELAKCQRYFQIFHTQALRPTYRQDYRPEMAVNPQSGATDVNQPTLGTIEIDGTTYYTASAES